MEQAPSCSRRIRIGPVELDPEAGHIWKDGVRSYLPEQPLAVLQALIDARGRVVSRDELRSRLWPDDTFVDFEHGVNAAVKRLREALGDSADSPRFIETIPRRGYCLIAPVSEVESADPAPVHEVRGIPPPIDAPGNVSAANAASGRWGLRVGWLAGATFLAVGAALTLRSIQAPRLAEPSAPASSRMAVTFELAMPPGVTARPDLGLAGVSPNGRYIAVVAERAGEERSIWVRDLAGGDAVPLPGSAGADQPFWSPDSSSLGFFQDARLRVIVVGGGPPRDVCAAYSPRGGTWNEDHTIVFGAGTRSPLFMVPDGGGTPSQITKLDPIRRDVSHRFPSFLPDGRHFVFLLWAGDVERQGIYLGSLDGTEPVRLLPDLSSAIWSAGHLFFVRRETLVAQAMDGNRLSGEARVVATSIGRDPGDYVALAASPGGDLVFQRGQNLAQLAWFDRSGRQLSNLGPPAQWGDQMISPDGSRVAYAHRDRAAGKENIDIWIETIANHVRTPLTLDPAIDVLPVWSPNGREVIFRSNRSGFSGLYRKRPDAAEPESLLLASNTRKDPTDWSPDGHSLLVTEIPAGGHQEIWLHDVEGRQPPRPVVKERAPAFNGRFSPDGRYIVYESLMTGRREVYVQSMDGSRRWRVSTDGGTQPAWRADGRELFFVSGNQITAVEVSPARDGWTFGTPHRLFESAVLEGLRNGLAVSPDGQRFLITVAVPEPHPTQVVLHWQGRDTSGDPQR